MNSTLDIQWQPRNDLAIDIGFVNGLGRHEVIPIPFNQARIATPTNPLCGTAAVCANPSSPFPLGAHISAQFYTYGYTVQQPCVPAFFNACAINMPNGPQGQSAQMLVNFRRRQRGPARPLYRVRGGVGVVRCRRNLGLQRFASARRKAAQPRAAGWAFPTRSHARSTSRAPWVSSTMATTRWNMRNAYGPSDFDRTHVINIDYHYELPKFCPELLLGKVRSRMAGPFKVLCDHSKRAAIQHGRLLRSGWKRLLQHLRRNHESHRALKLRQWLHAAERGHGGKSVPHREFPALKPILLHGAAALSLRQHTRCQSSTGGRIVPLLQQFRVAMRLKPISRRASATFSANPGKRAPTCPSSRLRN